MNLGKTLKYVRNLKAGNHGIFFYEDPQEKREVLFSFLQAGLETGEGAVYVAAQEPSAQIRRHMEDFGLNVQSLYKDGLLRILDYDEWYIIDGKVNVPYMTRLGNYMFQEAMEMGLKGLRGCGETACFFEYGKEKKLMEYERIVGTKFDLPVTVLCAYDVHHIRSLEIDAFSSLLRAHGPVLTHSFAQEVIFEDFFLEIIDDVLETIFGETGKETIMRILDERLSFTPTEIGESPKVFLEGLEDIVGSGARVVAKSIAARMCTRIGIAEK